MMFNKRRVTSLLMLTTVMVLSVTGVLSFFTEYTRSIATTHTIFGILFTFLTLVHLTNNIKPITNYVRNWSFLIITVMIGSLLYSSVSESSSMKSFMDFGARSKASTGSIENDAVYEKIVMDFGNANSLTVDVKKAKHFWHPQVAVWTEDTSGLYKETLFATKATAKGIFAGGRSKENFKSLDAEEVELSEDSYRRVNALPVWSHKRGVQYKDGLYAPTYENPLPDGMTGATPLSNFILETSVNYTEPFILKMEVNVAFDDNEYYSEYDFPDDKTFHNGTGQLGQPSIIFACQINPLSNQKKLMHIEGHGHHSGQGGMIYDDLSTITTALEIVDFAVVSFQKKDENGTM